MKFRVLRGIHANENGVYRQGAVLETNIDLVKRFNQGSTSMKFARVEDSTPVTEPDQAGVMATTAVIDSDISFDISKEGLSKLTVEQLKKLAAEEGIALSSTIKSDIINEILGEE